MTTEVKVDTLEDQEGLENTNTEEDNIPEDQDDTSDDNNLEEDQDEGNNDSTDGEDDSDDEEEIDYDSLSDEEFEEYYNKGKKPVKTESKPEDTKSNKEPQSETIPDKDSKTKDTQKETDSKPTKEQKTEIDYKAQYEEIFKPFKANGKELTPKDINDIRTLMQKGANYTQKMQDIKPYRRVVESLNKAGINEDSLNLLIDVHNGDPEAIKKVIQLHKLDPMEFDLEDIKHVNKNHMVSDAEVEYAQTLDDVESSLPQITELLSKRWDSSSKEKVLSDPRILKALHEEISMGRFDEVQARLESEKTFGRYDNVSDLDAYIDVLQRMVAEKQKEVQSKAPVTKPTETSKSTNTPRRIIPSKKGAAPNKAGQSAPQVPRINREDIGNMSDEEFSKLSPAQIRALSNNT